MFIHLVVSADILLNRLQTRQEETTLSQTVSVRISNFYIYLFKKFNAAGIIFSILAVSHVPPLITYLINYE